jgi:hypothetical protein
MANGIRAEGREKEASWMCEGDRWTSKNNGGEKINAWRERNPRGKNGGNTTRVGRQHGNHATSKQDRCEQDQDTRGERGAKRLPRMNA